MMNQLFFKSSKISLFIVAGLCVMHSAVQAGDLPSFDKVDAVVQRHFATLPGYEVGDLISRNQAKPVFQSIDRLGWKVADESVILNSVLSDSNYLVQEFRTPAGQQFMRKVAGTPLALDRLDQLARLPGGKLMVKDFLRFPNSDLTFTDKSGFDVSQLARLQPPDSRSGITASDLNKPTGRIYSVDGLVSRLRQSYDEELKRRQPSAR